MIHLEKEILILESIYKEQNKKTHLRQRDLAKIAGLSLGMTNSILKRLIEKGFLMVRKVNNRNIQYIVSAKGIEEITKRSYRYFKRTIKNVVFYKEAIEKMIRRASKKGFEGVLLIGKSDLGFIVEHACAGAGVKYIKDEKGEKEFKGRIFHIYSESYIPDKGQLNLIEDSCFLQELLV